jgi:cell division protease FtsH
MGVSKPGFEEIELNIYRNLFIWLLIGALMILLFDLLSTPKQLHKEITFSDFISKIESDQVVEVTIKENELMGVLKDGTSFKTFVEKYPEFINELRTKNVKIIVKPPAESPWYVNFFFSWGPIIFLALIWIFFMRQMQMGGNRALSFGKAKVRLVSDKTRKFTFKDV